MCSVFLGGISPPDLVAAIVGVDCRNYQRQEDGSDNLGTGCNFDAFRTTIVELGHEILLKYSFETGDLQNLDALIVGQPYKQNPQAGFSPSEIMAIDTFVRNGDGLIVIADGGVGSDEMVDNLNSLVAPFGVVYASTATEGSGYDITNLVSHPVTAGVDIFGVDYQRRLSIIGSPTIDLTIGSGADDALAVVCGVGRAGNVVLVSDMMWPDPDVGSDRHITFGDNQLLLENIIQYTVPEPASMVLVGLCGMAVLTHRRR
jgi:hypothetical protein